MIGIDPSPFTLRAILEMYQAKRTHDWGLAGSVMSLLANVNRDPKRRRRPYTVADFVPADLAAEFRQANQRRGMTGAALRAMKPLFQKEA